jgi:two-component system, response regulator
MDGGKVILLVEDNRDDELLTLRALKKNKIANEVVVARDGEQAIAYLSATEGRAMPAIVLLDLNLPKVTGLDVLRALRADARTRLVPVVVLTSSKEEEDIVESYQLGANAYMRKLVDFEHFTDAMKTLGLFWLVLNELPRRRS